MTRPPAVVRQEDREAAPVSLESLVFGHAADTDPRYRLAYDALVKFKPDTVRGAPVLEALQDVLSAMSLASTRAQPEGAREKVAVVLDVFLAAYPAIPDDALFARHSDDDLLTFGDMRAILAALNLQGGAVRSCESAATPAEVNADLVMALEFAVGHLSKDTFLGDVPDEFFSMATSALTAARAVAGEEG